MDQTQTSPNRTARYLELIESLGKQRGFKHGWAKVVAADLGISTSQLASFIAGRSGVSARTAHRAIERLGIPSDFFDRTATRSIQAICYDIDEARFPGGLSTKALGGCKDYTPIK